MSRIQLSSHRLMMETGRWDRPHSIPYEERKCIVCDTIEDEFHFILECSRYADIRKNTSINITGPDQTYKKLMS